jgi:hypothetical protein
MLFLGVIEECGITETSLEDVFLGVTRDAGFKYRENTLCFCVVHNCFEKI